MNIRSIIALLTGALFTTVQIEAHAMNAHDFSFDGIDGKQIALKNFDQKVILVVNTASQCGFTPQYVGLQSLHEKYADKGLVIIGVPSKDFGGQEFDAPEEVVAFTNDEFHVGFLLTSISKVKGDSAHPFYLWAKKEAGFLGTPRWNFHKYLIDKNGNLAEWFASNTEPTAEKITQAIEYELNR